MSRFHPDGCPPEAGQVFVFGSNLSGIHGGGAARAAHRQYGAVWGVAEGITGNCYAIPTVKAQIAGPLSLGEIQAAIGRFLEFAEQNPQIEFFVTRIGCGLAGHKDADIAPMFSSAPANCSLPDTWSFWLHLPPVDPKILRSESQAVRLEQERPEALRGMHL
ncbi:hypothetical protein [uncultured Rhodoferax sp.]|uniref:A1S_2505 family phage non-structural protein n=1 Tax=uncultured Rhodoferax sp. TaxID=223188 RepID=UPI0025CD5EEC|nr:hypothetical protein [uncultured Rhodoferax sp.]